MSDLVGNSEDRFSDVAAHLIVTIRRRDKVGQSAYLMIFDDNGKIILSNLHKNLCCGCSLESPRVGDSNENPQHRFL